LLGVLSEALGKNNMATKIKRAGKFIKGEAIAIAMIVGGLLVVVIGVNQLLDSIMLQSIFGLLSFVCFIVVLFRVVLKRRREFRCPDCGGEVEEAVETASSSSSPILRRCEKCDVLWRVGHTPGSYFGT
jgi:Flp pilus assembly protein TadB